jgi:hypothetical protein
MTTVPDRSTFESAYAGQAPWDIGKPQKAFSNGAEWITGTVLNAGCGTGDNALFFAERGCTVLHVCPDQGHGGTNTGNSKAPT